MKVAVLVYGEFREFDTVIKYWDFLDNFNHDIFLSTWDYSLQINNKLGIYRERFITDEMIKSILPNSKFSILKESDYFDDHKNITMKNSASRVSLHWKNCLRLLEESGGNYDFIILTRTDNFTVFNLTSEEISQLKRDNVIYGLTSVYLCSPKEFFVQDMFFIGDFKNMSNFIKTIPVDLSGLHHGLSEHIINSNLYVEPIERGVNVTPYRPNCLYTNLKLDFGTVSNKHIEWHKTEKD